MRKDEPPARLFVCRGGVRRPLKLEEKLQSFARRCGIHNIDWRYYRDKYVGGLFVLAMIAALAAFSDWPPPHAETVQGVKFLFVALLCIAVSSYRLAALGALLAFVSLRFVLGAIIYRRWEGFAIGLIAGFGALLIVVCRLRFRGDYSLPYKIQPYSAAEAGLDILVFLLMLGLLHKLAI
jgi:hypothetical protein